jgi:hypothetical protein
MKEPSEWVAAGAAANDPHYAPGESLWGIPAMRCREVLINLDLLYPRDPNISPTRAVSGVNMTGIVRGVLYEGIQSGTGVWYGRCHFTMPYWDSHNGEVEVTDQLVPEHAVKKIARTRRNSEESDESEESEAT